jgi:hypothetical protein
LNYSEYNKNSNTWTFNNLGPAKANDKPSWTFDGAPVEIPKRPGDDVLIREIREHPSLEDSGFFDDIVEWLRRDAPKKLGRLLDILRPWPAGFTVLSHETLCEALYSLGFRASERLERRMILGTANEWTRKYFEDFPLGSREKE